jgi:hypothetical protein
MFCIFEGINTTPEFVDGMPAEYKSSLFDFTERTLYHVKDKILLTTD